MFGSKRMEGWKEEECLDKQLGFQWKRERFQMLKSPVAPKWNKSERRTITIWFNLYVKS